MKLVLFLLSAAAIVAAQQTGPALTIDANANQHPISPDIYGINFYWTLPDQKTDPTGYATAFAASTAIRPTVRRWGGNNTSTYHWKFDVDNIDADWFYEVLPDPTVDVSKLPEGSQFNTFADQARTTGGKIYGTIPVLGYLPKARARMCSFDVGKYGKQCKVDYWWNSCGNGILYDPACGDPTVSGGSPPNPQYITNDPTDAYAKFDESLQADWVGYLVTRYGKANQGGVTILALDNEPIWWDSTHRDIHPQPYTYEELKTVNSAYAAAAKKADPTVLIAGPVADNWSSLWLSKADIVAGWNSTGNWWSNQVDRTAHGGVALMPWYLQQMRTYEQQNGQRILDYLDLHAYYNPSAVQDEVNGVTPADESAAIQALRLDSTRVLWDSTYVVSNDYWIKDPDNNGAPIAPALIPRLKQMVAQYYPGTRIAITEYNWHGLDTINGGLAQAELLGVFGREGLDLATLWGPPKPTDPAAFAFRFYRNYDGTGGAFGETGVQASSADASQLSVFAALRSDLNLTAVVINKTNNDLTSSLSLANFGAGSAAKVWRYSSARTDAILPQPDVTVSNASLTTVFPANSMTMLVIPPASTPVPKPSVAAVTDAAAYGTSIAPGQAVVVWGKGFGQAALTLAALDSNGLLASQAAGVRVLFDGVPAPLIYTSATQVSAVVPYFGAINATTHLQVEYQGVRSDPLAVPVIATAPALFTSDFTGKGQATAFNDDNVTRNSPSAPAKPGSIVVLWGTGEGITNPPGVDGRPAVVVVPKPVAPVSVDIGGLPATVLYAGAAPGNIPGLLQINAQMSPNVQPGTAVPVHVKVGNATSADGVTIAVR
jgi:uncharacterized protein (TIGR03437 family)